MAVKRKAAAPAIAEPAPGPPANDEPKLAADAPRPKDEFAGALRQCMPLFWLAGAFSGGVNLLFLSSPLYLIQIYNRVIPSGSMATLAALSAVLLLALMTMVVLDAVRARLLIRAAARLDRLLSDRVFQAILDLSRRHGGGKRTAQPLRDLDQFRSALAGPAAQLFFDAPWTPLFLIVLFLIHPILGIVATLGAALLLGLAWINDVLTRQDAGESSDAAVQTYGFTDSLARHADPVHAMGMTDALQVRWREGRGGMLGRQAEASDRNADFAAIMRFSRMALQGAMLGVGAWLVIRGSILPASIFAASLVMGRALAPLEQAVVGWRQLRQAIGAGRRVQRALSEAPPPRRVTRLPQADGSLSIKAVTYVPPGAKTPALNKVSVDIEPGEAVGVIGASGAGKSSLARLMVAAGLPTSGRVMLGGIETKRWRRDTLAAHVGYLPQVVGLLPGTIRDNIARFQDVDDAQVVRAAKRANVHDMILAMADGYETVIAEGGMSLSGGERQRIGLARALFGDPKLLVLDEPNAHLDQEGERALAATLKALKAQGVTLVLVAHRLNPLSEVDRVLLLDRGRLTSEGTPREVIAEIKSEIVHSIAPVPADPARRSA
jgi:PrtD family type I secretion system ABC transporter